MTASFTLDIEAGGRASPSFVDLIPTSPLLLTPKPDVCSLTMLQLYEERSSVPTYGPRGLMMDAQMNVLQGGYPMQGGRPSSVSQCDYHNDKNGQHLGLTQKWQCPRSSQNASTYEVRSVSDICCDLLAVTVELHPWHLVLPSAVITIMLSTIIIMTHFNLEYLSLVSCHPDRIFHSCHPDRTPHSYHPDRTPHPCHCFVISALCHVSCR